MNIIFKILIVVSCPNQMFPATLFAGYKCTGEQMLLATILATNKCVGGQMLTKIYLLGGRFFCDLLLTYYNLQCYNMLKANEVLYKKGNK